MPKRGRTRRTLPTEPLCGRYTEFVAGRSAASADHSRELDRRSARRLAVWKRHGIVTLADLLERVDELPRKSRDFARWLFCIWNVREAIPFLVRQLDDPRTRIDAASDLGFLESGRRVETLFLRHARRELASSAPAALWLDAALHGLRYSKSTDATEIVVSIYERSDLPGWLRGNAGDILGCMEGVSDRRTRWYRRSCVAALRGLTDDSIEVQAWSMYVISQLVWSPDYEKGAPRRRDLAAAIPLLRQIARDDQRLFPGYWWPMSAEAEDTLYCLKHGQAPEADAGERFSRSSLP